MGVYIKGMEMPKNCHSCPMCLMRFCQARDRELSEQETRPNAKCPEDCPLIPVPPHGDLIDRDAARGSIKPWSPEDERNGCTFDTVKKLMHTMLDRAPAIIPASEEGE